MPIRALPANHATPNPVSKRPNAVARRAGSTMPATRDSRTDSVSAMPIPQRIIPRSAAADPPRKTNGREKRGDDDGTEYGPRLIDVKEPPEDQCAYRANTHGDRVIQP